jgi:ABC-type multidrug transport system fused ATPase/permease subunit
MCSISVQAWLQFRLDRKLREEVFMQLLYITYEELNQRRDSDWQLILNSETGRAASAVFGVVGMGSSLMTMLVYTGVLIAVSWQMTLIATILLVLVFGALTSMVRLADRVGQQRFQRALDVQHGTLETVNAKRIIRLMQQQEYERERYFGMLQRLQRVFVILRIVTEASRQLLEVLVIGLLALLLLISGLVIDLDERAIIPLVSTFVLILYRMLPHVLSLNQMRTSISSDLASVRSIANLIDTDERYFVKDGHRAFDGLQQSIRLDNVSFQYMNREASALMEVTMEIRRGETVALVGSSGAGKSTLADLLTRLYDPQQGRILIDGVDLRELKLADWRRHIGVVSQDTFVFNNTIGYNIGYGSNASQEDIERAARHANAHQFILELPKGYQTQVGDRGVFLSGGQRQRIAIARAILRDPEILILDEATSALDSENERLIQAALDHLSANRTSLVIAHRLSTILNADQIVVLEEGRVIESGTHSVLLARDTRYSRLYHSQFEHLSAPPLE